MLSELKAAKWVSVALTLCCTRYCWHQNGWHQNGVAIRFSQSSFSAGVGVRSVALPASNSGRVAAKRTPSGDLTKCHVATQGLRDIDDEQHAKQQAGATIVHSANTD